MGYRIEEVQNNKDLKKWVKFQFNHYKNHPYFVPQLINDEVDYFKKSNPAYKVAQVKQYIAYDDNNTIVGRICGIIHSLETEKLGKKRGRFGWFESIENSEVAHLLLQAVKDWLVSEKCVEMTGPHGFTDLDPEGVLIDGFDHLPTVSGSYNYPYYSKLLESFGLEKDADYVEHRVSLPSEYPFFQKMKPRLAKNKDYKIAKCTTKKELIALIPGIWEVLEKAFAPLYGVTPLTKEQNEYYTKKHFSFLDPQYIKVVVDTNEKVVGFFIGMPNVSKGFKKANGKMLPLGLLHILKNFKKTDAVDFLLAGIDPEVPSNQVFMMMAIEMYETLIKNGITTIETNRELEDNAAVVGIWTKFEHKYFRRSRIYRTTL